MRNLGRHYIAIIALRYGYEYLALLDPGLLQYILIDAVAYHALALELVAEASEGFARHVDHRNVVAVMVHHPRERRADAPAAQYDHIHSIRLPLKDPSMRRRLRDRYRR